MLLPPFAKSVIASTTVTASLAIGLACGGAPSPAPLVPSVPAAPTEPEQELTPDATTIAPSEPQTAKAHERLSLPRPVMLVQTVDGKCVWRLADVTSAPEQVHVQDGPCPSSLDAVWPNEQIASVDGDELVLEAWRTAGKTARLSLPPGTRSELRYLAENPGADPFITVGVRHDAILEERNGERFFVAGDMAVNADGVVPPWGDRAVVTIHELHDNIWKVVATEAATFGVDTLNFDGGYFGRREQQGASWQTIQGRCNTPNARCTPYTKATQAAVEIGTENVGFIGSSEGWLYGLAFGDTWHAVGPVFYCDDSACAKRVRLIGIADGEAVSLQHLDGWLLVSEEYSGARPRLYTIEESEPVASWPGVQHSRWDPSTFLP